MDMVEVLASPASDVDAVACTRVVHSFRQHATSRARHPQRGPAKKAPLVVQQLSPEAGIGPHERTLLQNHLVSLPQAEGLKSASKRPGVTH